MLQTQGTRAHRTRTPHLAALGALLLALVAALALVPTAPAAAASGTLLRDGTGLYPRAVRLQHSGDANGRILASVVTFSGSDGLGAIYESTDDGASFRQVGTVADPEAAHGQGLCCATLYELPRQIGSLPAGTLLWAASVGQDESPRRMALRVFYSTDVGRSWSYLSTIATAGNDRGLWEPEFSVDAAGELVAHYSDETDPAHSQKLMAARSTDGVHWTGHHATVASSLASDRPGMPVVRRLPDGTYFMVYEICAAGGQFSCVVHYRTSADGWNWGDPAYLGIRPETADGQYFKHTPNLAWAPEPGNPQGRLILVGQVLHNADGSRAAGSGRTIWTNSDSGRGAWTAAAAPVAVESQVVDYCPNYSSALLPTAGGARVLEIATDYDGGVCKPYFATGSVTAPPRPHAHRPSLPARPTHDARATMR
ncbi:MAG TPA: exo-alpha-sialidase [Streptomyces sp.]|nr:exo-alpha-sialidase [Streptomyces sp.]